MPVEVQTIHQGSALAEPHSPIASSKRSSVSTSKRPRAGQCPKEKRSDGRRHPVLESTDSNQTQEISEAGTPASNEESSETCQTDGGAEDGEDWKGRVVALFSPVLRFVGANQEGEQPKIDGPSERESPANGMHDQHAENDPNWDNCSLNHMPDKYLDEPRVNKEEAGGIICHQNLTAEEAERDEAEMDVERPDEVEDDIAIMEEFNPYLFIKQLPPYEHVGIPGKICLPPRKHTRSTSSSITLVLDLDETLVHCTVESVPDPDVIFPVEFNGVQYQVHVRKRPYLEEFLAKVSSMFEVVVFTASQQVYADALLNIIDPNQRLVRYRLFRDACLPVEGNYIKDLNVLGRDIAKTILVDNSPYAYGYQLDNGIPIESWFDDRNDTELLKLISFLEGVQSLEDVRPLIRQTYKTYLLVQQGG